MIYNVNGDTISSVYGKNGTSLDTAYDKDGSVVFADHDLIVMSYNVGQWYIGNGSNVPVEKYNDYYTLQRSILSAYRPDIVGFQEYYDPFSTGHSVADVIGTFFTDHKNNANTGYSAKALYVNGYTISNYSSINFTNGSSQNFIVGKITAKGQTIWLINAHLATSSQEANKVAQAEELFDYVTNLDYFIIFADFNTVCKSVNDTEYTTIMKQFIDAGYNSANCSNQHGFLDTWTSSSTASGEWYPCDQIITSANIDIDTVMVDTTKITDTLGETIDHLPIIAGLTIH